MREITSLNELKSLIGQTIAASDWIDITQDRIDQFAVATGDMQWIHVDVARSQSESPFGGTVAHGFLTLSLLPVMMSQSLTMSGVQMSVNYGLNKVRFPAPVPAGSRVRGHIIPRAVEDIPGGAQIVWDISIEREGSGKPVCVAEFVTRRYP
jgi:acyl dehydratase